MLNTEISHDHRLSRGTPQPYKGMLLAGLKAHRKICDLHIRPAAANAALYGAFPCEGRWLSEAKSEE